MAPGVNIQYHRPVRDVLALPPARRWPHRTWPAGSALLLSAFPNLTADQQVAALTGAAADLGPVGADNTFGNGRLDLQAAYNWLAGGGAAARHPPLPRLRRRQPRLRRRSPPTPTPMPPTPTPVPGLHIGDLDGSKSLTKTGWTAGVTTRGAQPPATVS